MNRFAMKPTGRWAAVLMALLAASSASTNAQPPSGSGTPTFAPPTGSSAPTGHRDPSVASLAGRGLPETRTVATIIALVDDKPILLEDVLAPLKPMLKQRRGAMPEDKYREFERELIKQRTDLLVQRAVILLELEAQFAKAGRPEQIYEIREAARKDFEAHMQRVAASRGMTTGQMLDELAKEGMTLEDNRREFIDTLICQQYLRQLTEQKRQQPSRQEMVDYYREHRDEFHVNGSATWRQIQIKFGSDPRAAAARIEDLRRRADSVETFAAFAKEHSDGATAVLGGLWEKTSPGGYADEAVDRAVCTLPVGRVSPTIQGEKAYHLVWVESRIDEGFRPFSAVQDEVKSKLAEEQSRELRKTAIDEMLSRHYVETIFDGDEDKASRVAEAPATRR